MTFTYNLADPNNITRVRYHIGDVIEEAAIFSDEEIAFILAEEGDDWRAAVIASIRGIMARIGHEPDMQADWLRIEWRTSSENWRRLLSEKKREFGLGARASGGGEHAWRPDLQDKPPSWPVG